MFWLIGYFIMGFIFTVYCMYANWNEIKKDHFLMYILFMLILTAFYPVIILYLIYDNTRK